MDGGGIDLGKRLRPAAAASQAEFERRSRCQLGASRTRMTVVGREVFVSLTTPALPGGSRAARRAALERAKPQRGRS